MSNVSAGRDVVVLGAGASLRMPLEEHTGESLIRAMRERLALDIGERVPDETLRRYVARHGVDRAIARRTRRDGFDAVLVVAPGGAGKSTWSAVFSHRHAETAPVVWCAATDLAFEGPDPLGVRVMQAAFGTPDPGRIPQLASLLHAEHLRLRVIVDAIDEAKDYALLLRCLRSFANNGIASATSLVLTCRTEAFSHIERALSPTFPVLFAAKLEGTSQVEGGLIRLDELSERDAEMLLRRAGATPEEIRDIQTTLRDRYSGNPLFLLQALELRRIGRLPTDGSVLMPAIAERLVLDIRKRLTSAGRAPSVLSITTFLERVALRALEAPREVIDLDEVQRLAGATDEGENTLPSRAVQAGVLEPRGSNFVGFRHALFLEYFAAKGLARSPTNWSTWLAQTDHASRHAIVQRIAAALDDPTPLVRAVFNRERVAGAELVASLGLKAPALADEAVAVAKELLASRFPSDHRRALHILSRLGGASATKTAIDWFNSLAQDEKSYWVTDAADLFLTLECIGAFGVILWHRHLHPQHPWFEPAFVRAVERLSPAFQENLRARLRKELETTLDGDTHARCVLLLSLLRDDWLVEHLRQRVAQSHLNAAEHLALIFLNTEDALLVYAESAEKYFEEIARIGESGADLNDYGRRTLDYSLVLLTSDVRMYPHDQLIELVNAALGSQRRAHLVFGCKWARMLSSPKLADAYASAVHSLGGFFRLTADMFQSLARELTFEELRELYDKSNRHAQQQIVHYMYNCPGAATEAFLMDRLREPHHRFDAIQSLGILGSPRAGHAIHFFIHDSNRGIRDIAITALGRLRYRPAVGDLVALLLRTVKREDRLSETDQSNLEHDLIESLGRIGGADAHEGLLAASPDTMHPDVVLNALLRSGERSGLDAVHLILRDHPHACAMLPRAITWWNEDDGYDPFHAPRAIDDAVLFESVLAYARTKLADPTVQADLLERPILAVSAFTDPRAIQFLEEVARGVPSSEDAAIPLDLNPVSEARKILASRGYSPHQRELLEETLTNRAQLSVWSSTAILRDLSSWPREMVHEALLDRIARKESPRDIHFAVSVLRWYALPSDRKLFRELEQGSNLALADIAHDYLQRPSRYT